MAHIVQANGTQQVVTLDLGVYGEARDAGVSLEQHINRAYQGNYDPQYGSPYRQLLASEGLTVPRSAAARREANAFGLRAPLLKDILSTSSEGVQAGTTNVVRKTDPFGSQSRYLFPIAVVTALEDAVQPDRLTDNAVFRSMAATTLPVAGSTFAQPILDYNTAGGANTGSTKARASRVSQMGQVPTMLTLTTSDKYYTIPTYGIGIEMSDQARQATPFDVFTLALTRYFSIEKDERVYTYLSQLFSGDLDKGTSAISAVTSTTLNGAATSGVMTHKAWVLFLARSRKLRKIDYLICDISTYMKIESRTGRPGSNAYDPTLARIDPQMIPATPLPFGGDVKWMIVEPATAGGPVPANTVWALDSTQAFMMVENTEASYQAVEEFVLRRSQSMVWHWSEEVMRLYPTDTTAFDVLTID